MVAETVELLAPARGGLFVDCTVGLGGHARALLEAGATRILGLDRDPDALQLARERAGRVRRPRRAGARRLPRPAARARRARPRRGVDGALADLGVSSMQLEARRPRLQLPPRRSARHADGSLAGSDRRRLARHDRRGVAGRRDLRVRRGAVLAPHRAGHRRRAQAEPRSRTTGRWRRSCAARSRGAGYQRIDPATRTFQALRIWVNRELERLDALPAEAAQRLLGGARLAVITFHSLEDRIVKHAFRALAQAEAGAAGR